MPEQTESAAARAWRAGAVTALAGWLAATTLGQHPVRAFDGVRRRLAPHMTVPDWRFFAPQPGQWDEHLLVRTLDEHGDASPWRELQPPTPRRLRHALYHPAHRREKGLIDSSDLLLREIATSPVDVTKSVEYALLRGFVAARLRAEPGPKPVAFQFLLVRDSGYDAEGELLERLVSPREEL